MGYKDNYKNIEKFVESLCGLDQAIGFGLHSWGRWAIFQNLNHKTEGFNPQLVSLLIEEMKQAKAEVDSYPYAEKPDYYQNCEPYRIALQMLSDEVAKAQPDGSTQKGSQLPEGLDTPEANKYWQRAKELGLIDEGYKWQRGQQLLSCFCREMSNRLKLGKGERVNWKIFEPVFGVKPDRLRGNYNDIQKTGQQPIGSDDIDKVFE